MIILHGDKFKSKEESYIYLNEKFDFEYEVKNLDGLFDQLSIEDEKVIIKDYKKIYENLDSYGEKIIICFMKASLLYDLDVDFLKN